MIRMRITQSINDYSRADSMVGIFSAYFAKSPFGVFVTENDIPCAVHFYSWKPDLNIRSNRGIASIECDVEFTADDQTATLLRLWTNGETIRELLVNQELP